MIPKTRAGADALAEVKSGLLSGLSVEFKSIKEDVVGGIRKISKAILVGAGLVDSPAYADAVVEAAGTGRASCKRPSYKGVFTVRSLRSWFTEDRASDVAPTFTNQILGRAFETVRGIDGIRATAAIKGAMTLIGAATGVASLTGQHSDALQGHLSQIAREMVGIGESNWLINVGSTGEVVLLPVTVSTVVGGPDPRSWLYSVMLNGPSQTMTVQRSGESILSFRLRVDSRTPWRGRPAIGSTGTGQLLSQLEKQIALESKSRSGSRGRRRVRGRAVERHQRPDRRRRGGWDRASSRVKGRRRRRQSGGRTE